MPRRLCLALLLFPLPALAQTAAPEVVLPELVVEAQRAAAARQGILARFGAREVTVERETIEALPGGASQPLNQVLLQTPGVVQDSFGDIHVRGEHRNLQYRLNGVALPEGLTGFGQVFDARSLRSVSVLTGALPAQFGFRTNAVIDLETRTGTLDPGGSIGVYGGSRGTWQPHLSWAGIAAGWDVFATGTFLRSQQGVENPTSSWQSINGQTEQWRGLAYAARQLDDTTRLSLIFGGNANRFNLPVTRGLAPEFTAFGLDSFDSAALRARQWERNWYGVAALQKSWGDIDLQVAPFFRYSSISYTPSLPGEVIFNGSAASVFRASMAAGVQADAAWRIAADHTLRFGGQVTGERAQFRSDSTVLPLDADGNAIDAPFVIGDRYGRTGWLYGMYLQDEWRLTERLTLNLGLRWDQAVQYTAAGQVSPRINLVWRPTDTTTIHAGYARTFTPPQFESVQASSFTRYLGTTAAPESLENGLARPQRDHRFDLGISQRFGQHLTLGIDGYYKFVRDLLDFGQFGNALIFTPFNFRQGRVYGVEFSGNWRDETWLIYGNLALSRSVGRDLRSGQFAIEPDELAYIASKYVRTDHDQLITGSAGVVWNGWEGGQLSGSMLYGSGLRKGFAATEKVTPYAVFNFGVRQAFTGPDGGRWTARLDLLNAFDRSYQLRDGTGIGVGAAQYGLRRTIYAGLSREF
ncbi:TonB-dependent receptor [Siccirubricoccus sp. KC 17139]|uniref:TonB-dependent receptor n=1 Tax=Siccirubricoccus soli TaxID=2899147 RepID=A0ABT1DDG1_9PROT|nr:TonB-dependent receptor [Siccirubricoccus soli]MCO6418980.1 TonB-dependent receptor [Siccirubricoccus soli]MCP2685115.1 TonB-dependent receptor [Siccirubricoccus soli]